MRFLIATFVVMMLSACAGNVRQAESTRFDLGPVAVAWQPASLPVRGVSVFAPSWLGTTAIQYRMLYADPLSRQSYAESRWVAPPAELVERALNRQPASAVGGCRLRLDLDELMQVFDGAQSSKVQIDVRASLVLPGRDAVLAKKAFSVVRAAPTADARGGVAAASAAVQALAGELGAWLDQSARDDAALAGRCRAS